VSGITRYIGRGNPSWPFVAPFAAFAALLALGPHVPGGAAAAYPLRVAVTLAVLLIWSRGVVELRPARPAASAAVGAVVFFIWIGPDLLWPGYRSHWLLQNAVTGAVPGGVPPGAGAWFLFFRAAGSALLVPVVEELFWRAWLMRYLIARDFRRVAPGTWSASSFWITAVLFASEHGAYWDVGLAAGIIYNWWMIRTRSLADCILAHAVTNGCLAAYVLAAGQWQYWP
jgi:CAAX prenyl protease-like protein